MDHNIKNKVEKYECPTKSYALNYPVYFERGEGIYLYDSEYNQYIDCLNGFGVNILGHNHPIITEAGINFFKNKYPFQILDMMSGIRDEYIQTLFSLFPESMKNNLRIQFAGGSGSDAVEIALELARKYKNRELIMSFAGGYHGLTLGAMSLVGNICDKYPCSYNNVFTLPFPNSFHCPFGIGGDEGTNAILHYITNILTDPKGCVPKPAAIIMEVVQSDGGINIAPYNFVKEIRRITEEMDILLIIDEVQTGFGKTGKMFGFQHYDIEPDIIVLSKALGCGMPLSAIIFKDKINIPCSHGTFRGNQIGMYLGNISIDYILKNNILDNVLYMEKLLIKLLTNLKEKHKCIGEFRIKGLLFAIEFCIAKTNIYDTDITKKIFNNLFSNKLLCKLGGRNKSSLLFWIPLIVDEDTIYNIYNVIDKSISSCA